MIRLKSLLAEGEIITARYPNGSKKEVRTYSGSGSSETLLKVTIYYENGKILSVDTYNNGQRTRQISYHLNGNKSQELTSNMISNWNDSGKLERRVVLVSGSYPWTYRFKDGKLAYCSGPYDGKSLAVIYEIDKIYSEGTPTKFYQDDPFKGIQKPQLPPELSKIVTDISRIPGGPPAENDKNLEYYIVKLLELKWDLRYYTNTITIIGPHAVLVKFNGRSGVPTKNGEMRMGYVFYRRQDGSYRLGDEWPLVSVEDWKAWTTKKLQDKYSEEQIKAYFSNLTFNVEQPEENALEVTEKGSPPKTYKFSVNAETGDYF